MMDTGTEKISTQEIFDCVAEIVTDLMNGPSVENWDDAIIEELAERDQEQGIIRDADDDALNKAIERLREKNYQDEADDLIAYASDTYGWEPEISPEQYQTGKKMGWYA